MAETAPVGGSKVLKPAQVWRDLTIGAADGLGRHLNIPCQALEATKAITAQKSAEKPTAPNQIERIRIRSDPILPGLRDIATERLRRQSAV